MATSLQKQIRQLEELSRVQRRFVSDVSHELRTPLTTVRMAGDVLHDARRGLRPGHGRAAELLQTELDRFETLLVDLLEISRFDAGAALLDVDDVNLVDVAHRVVDMTRALADQRGVAVRRPGPGHPCLAEADVRRVERIVRNLVTNAIDHAESGPTWDRLASPATSTPPRSRSATTASGSAAGESAMVFNRFWRADPARARTSGGTGLGLSISLEDTHLHGGWLQAWGRPGEGAQFRLTLPRRAGASLRQSPLPLVPEDAAEPVRERPAARRAPSASGARARRCSCAGLRRHARRGPVVETRVEAATSPATSRHLHRPQPPAATGLRPRHRQRLPRRDDGHADPDHTSPESSSPSEAAGDLAPGAADHHLRRRVGRRAAARAVVGRPDRRRPARRARRLAGPRCPRDEHACTSG